MYALGVPVRPVTKGRGPGLLGPSPLARPLACRGSAGMCPKKFVMKGYHAVKQKVRPLRHKKEGKCCTILHLSPLKLEKKSIALPLRPNPVDLSTNKLQLVTYEPSVP